MRAHITLLPGDGIGPELVRAARRVLEVVAETHDHELSFETHLIGGSAIDATGRALPEETARALERADAVLLGAVGGPAWDDPGADVRPEQGLLELRASLGLFSNLRPVRVLPGLESASPLRPDIVAGVDLLFVRELTGGIYFGRPRGREVQGGVRRGYDTMTYDENEVRRIVQLAFELARVRRGKVTSVDKANVLDAMRLWREVATEVAAENPDVEFESQLVDSAAMRLVTAPAEFDVIVAGNMFGDILSDEGAVLTGTLGVLPSASLGTGTLGVYEPIHGSAPDLAGTGRANPVGEILSAAMLLRHSLGLDAEALTIERAVEQTIATGLGTADLVGERGALTTEGMTDAVISRLTTRAETSNRKRGEESRHRSEALR